MGEVLELTKREGGFKSEARKKKIVYTQKISSKSSYYEVVK